MSLNKKSNQKRKQKQIKSMSRLIEAIDTKKSLLEKK